MLGIVSDARLQELERRWIASGDPADEAALLRERVRVGGLDERHLEVVPWLRGLAERPAGAKVLDEASQRLSAREAFALGFDLTLGLQPSYRDHLPADLVTYRWDPTAPTPLARAAATHSLIQHSSLRVYRDPIPDLLRSIASPPAGPAPRFAWALNLIPGMRSLRESPLRALWTRLTLFDGIADREDRVWRAALEGLLETILERKRD